VKLLELILNMKVILSGLKVRIMKFTWSIMRRVPGFVSVMIGRIGLLEILEVLLANILTVVISSLRI
jgi:hypothetical protein